MPPKSNNNQKPKRRSMINIDLRRDTNAIERNRTAGRRTVGRRCDVRRRQCDSRDWHTASLHSPTPTSTTVIEYRHRFWFYAVVNRNKDNYLSRNRDTRHDQASDRLCRSWRADAQRCRRPNAIRRAASRLDRIDSTK